MTNVSELPPQLTVRRLQIDVFLFQGGQGPALRCRSGGEAERPVHEFIDDAVDDPADEQRHVGAERHHQCNHHDKVARQADGLHALLLCFLGRAGEACPSGGSGCNRRSASSRLSRRRTGYILGTLFERGLDPDKRSQLGAHYTDRDKIMRIVDPVIVRPLLAEWETVKADLAVAVERAEAGESAAARTRMRREADGMLRAFLERLRDPF